GTGGWGGGGGGERWVGRGRGAGRAGVGTDGALCQPPARDRMTRIPWGLATIPFVLGGRVLLCQTLSVGEHLTGPAWAIPDHPGNYRISHITGHASAAAKQAGPPPTEPTFVRLP